MEPPSRPDRGEGPRNPRCGCCRGALRRDHPHDYRRPDGRVLQADSRPGDLRDPGLPRCWRAGGRDRPGGCGRHCRRDASGRPGPAVRAARASDNELRLRAQHGQNERAIALNRKNALLAGSDGGGENWAIVASLVETCKLCGVDPQAYLAGTLAKIVDGHLNRQIDGSPALGLRATRNPQGRGLKTAVTKPLSRRERRVGVIGPPCPRARIFVSRNSPIFH